MLAVEKRLVMRESSDRLEMLPAFVVELMVRVDISEWSPDPTNVFTSGSC